MAIPNGYIDLYNNVPLTASYEHTIDFKDRIEQQVYFNRFIKLLLDNYTYIRKEREYIAVELPLSVLDDVNYLRFRSSDNDQRVYYAFVTDKVYVNPTTSYVYYTIDVLQTYMFDYQWRASYIAQGHVDRWTPDQKPIYSKTDEGLDYGNEYIVEGAWKIRQSDKVRWLLVSMVDPRQANSVKDGEEAQATDITIEGFVPSIGNFKPVESPFACYLLPVIMDGSITKVYANSGSTIELFSTYGEFIKFMLSSALGNYVRSISLLPYNPFIESESVSGEALHVRFTNNTVNAFTYFKKGDGTYVNLLCLSAINGGFTGVLAGNSWSELFNRSLPTAEEWAEIKANPRTTKRDKRFESKLLCSPYRYNLLTDWRNDPVIFKNEYMPTTSQISICYSMSFSYNAPFRYYMKDYKKDPEGRTTSLLQTIALEFPILSDAYYTYMLENKNTIQANITNAMINASTGAISGAISGAGIGGIGGAVYGGVTGAISGALNVQAQIRSENAKQSDLKMKPDTIINSTDSAFNIVDGNTELSFYRMRICCENEEIISEVFNMSGYKVNRVEVPNTRSRVRFNYLKTVGANIVGSFNQDDLLKIKAIYDKGVTIWHYSDYDFNPLDYSYENIEVNLL